MFSYVINSKVISLVLKDSDMDSENISLIWHQHMMMMIWHTVSDGQKTRRSKGVLLIGIL